MKEKKKKEIRARLKIRKTDRNANSKKKKKRKKEEESDRVHIFLNSQLTSHTIKAGPPPWFGFLVIFDFFAPWYRRRREASSVKIS